MVNLGTSLQLLLTQEIVRRQGEDTQEDSLTDTQVRLASSLCSLRRLCRGRGGQSGGQPHRSSGRDQPPASAHSGDCAEAGGGQPGGQPHRSSGRDQPPASAHSGDCREAGRGQSGGQPHRHSGRDQPPASAHSGDMCAEEGRGQSGGQPHRYTGETSLHLLLNQAIVQRQGEDSQEDSLTDTQVETSLLPLFTQEIVQRQEEDSLIDTQERPAFIFCSLRRLYRGRGRTVRRTAS